MMLLDIALLFLLVNCSVLEVWYEEGWAVVPKRLDDQTQPSQELSYNLIETERENGTTCSMSNHDVSQWRIGVEDIEAGGIFGGNADSDSLYGLLSRTDSNGPYQAELCKLEIPVIIHNMNGNSFHDKTGNITLDFINTISRSIKVHYAPHVYQQSNVVIFVGNKDVVTLNYYIYSYNSDSEVYTYFKGMMLTYNTNSMDPNLYGGSLDMTTCIASQSSDQSPAIFQLSLYRPNTSFVVEYTFVAVRTATMISKFEVNLTLFESTSVSTISDNTTGFTVDSSITSTFSIATFPPNTSLGIFVVVAVVILIYMTLSIIIKILRLLLLHSKIRINHARLMEIEQEMSRNRASLRQHNEHQEYKYLRPSERNLNKMLHDLVKWESFAIELPGISIIDVEKIKRDNPLNVDDQKLALYRMWLQVSPNASYSDVVKALRMIKENNMAIKIQDEISRKYMLVPERNSGPHLHQAYNVQKSTVDKLNELHKLFVLLSCECGEALKTADVSALNDLLSRLKKEKAYKMSFSQIQSKSDLINVVDEHCNFLNCHLVVVLVEHFLKSSELLEKVQMYEKRVEEFMLTTEIRDLQHSLEPFVLGRSKHDIPVTIKVHNCWGCQKMWLVNVLLETLFYINITDVTKWFKVIPGSFIVTILVPHHDVSDLITYATTKIEFLKLIGVISLQIGNTYVLKPSKNLSYSFRMGLERATNDENFEAKQFLLKYMDTTLETFPVSAVVIDIEDEEDIEPHDERGSSLTPHLTGRMSLQFNDLFNNI